MVIEHPARRARLLLLPLIGLLLAASLAACDEETPAPPEPLPDPDPVGSPYDEAASVRFIHLAPSRSNVTVELDLQPNTYRVFEVRNELGEAIDENGEVLDENKEPVRKDIEYLGEPEPRSITEARPLTLTAYTPELRVTTVPTANLTVMQGPNVAHEEALALENGGSYLVAMVESAGVSGIQTVPLWDFADGGDGQTRVGFFHAAAGLGTIDLAMQQVDGGSAQIQRAGLSLGTATLDDPEVTAPGTYRIVVLKGADEVEMVAPETLTLEADTYVQIILAAGATDTELPRMVFIVDGPGELETRTEADWQRVE